ncbi:MAG: hypothetical protein EBY83_08820, partial [Verrucomicrobia bacterium]|nr:hypothetical protein [Verrucomicrobiota bacterium]
NTNDLATHVVVFFVECEGFFQKHFTTKVFYGFSTSSSDTEGFISKAAKIISSEKSPTFYVEESKEVATMYNSFSSLFQEGNVDMSILINSGKLKPSGKNADGSTYPNSFTCGFPNPDFINNIGRARNHHATSETECSKLFALMLKAKENPLDTRKRCTYIKGGNVLPPTPMFSMMSGHAIAAIIDILRFKNSTRTDNRVNNGIMPSPYTSLVHGCIAFTSSLLTTHTLKLTLPMSENLYMVSSNNRLRGGQIINEEFCNTLHTLLGAKLKKDHSLRIETSTSNVVSTKLSTPSELRKFLIIIIRQFILVVDVMTNPFTSAP